MKKKLHCTKSGLRSQSSKSQNQTFVARLFPFHVHFRKCCLYVYFLVKCGLTQKDTYCLLATQNWYLVSFQGIWGCFVPRMDIIKHQIELFSGVWYIFTFLLQRKTKTLHRNWHVVTIVQITKPDVCCTTFPFTDIHSEVLPVWLLFGPCGFTRDAYCLLVTQR